MSFSLREHLDMLLKRDNWYKDICVVNTMLYSDSWELVNDYHTPFVK